MTGLFISLALLGLAAVDPIGIAAMPVLLIQKRPFVRSFTFLGGSFVSLMVMGVLLACGFGVAVLHFETGHKWLVPTVELIAGALLLAIAITLLWRLRNGRASVEPSTKAVRHLRLSGLQLFVFGSVLVAAQSLVDLVFVIAMIRVGQLHLSWPVLIAAVATYAVMALVLQLAVVMAFGLTPEKHRRRTLDKVHVLLALYGNQAVIGISALLGCGLLAAGALAVIN